MRSSLSTRPLMRAIAVMIAAVLTFGVASDAFGLDPCPHHSLPAAKPVAEARTAMHHHGASHAAPSSDSHSRHDAQHGVCTCMGACAISAAVPVPTAPELSVVITPVVNSHVVAPSIDAPSSLYLDLLPYGIAPPRADILL